MQGVRRIEHLPARSAKERVQGVRRVEHLPARSDKEQVQDVHSRQGRVDAEGSRGAVNVTRTGFSSQISATGYALGYSCNTIATPVSWNSEDRRGDCTRAALEMSPS